MKIPVYWYEKVAEKSAYPPIMVKSEQVEVPLYKIDEVKYNHNMVPIGYRNLNNVILNINDESSSYDFVVAYLPDGYGIDPVLTLSESQIKRTVDTIAQLGLQSGESLERR